MTIAGVSWGIAWHPARGQSVSGDRGLVTPRPGGALVVVADGLGHGAEAGRAADLVIRAAEENPAAPLVEILEQCHARLQETRGAAVSLAAWNGEQGALTWLGVGNVEGVVVRPGPSPSAKRPRLLLRGGVVGDRIPPLQAETILLPEAGLLVLATDGIASGFEQEVDPRRDPQENADWVLSRCSRQIDDALVLVARLRVREG